MVSARYRVDVGHHVVTFEGGFSIEMAYVEDRPLKTLRVEVPDDPERRWRLHTLAMAAGLTDHNFSD